MLSLLGFNNQTPSTTVRTTVNQVQVPVQEKKLGDLRDTKNIGEQLNDLKGKVERTMSKNKTELRKYRELTKFNETITKSYVANLKIIVDISQLLKAYNDFFDMFKSKLAEIDQELGLPISTNDFEYMKRLTTEQMAQLNDVFKRETGNLKKLYSRHGKQKEYDEVEGAEKLFDLTKANADVAYSTLKPPTEMPSTIFGGSKKTLKQRKQKATKAKK